MSHLQRSRALLIMLLLSAMSGPMGAAEPNSSFERSEWEPILRQQVKSARSCDIETILFANTLTIGDHLVLEGRLRCHDGREFTFTRKHEHQKFDFELCEPAVC